MNTNNDRPTQKSNRLLFWTLGGILLVGLISSLTFLRPTLERWLFPTEGCDPMLSLHGFQYRIETIQLDSDGALDIPTDEAGTVFWVEGTNTNIVFALGPTGNNLALEKSIQGGETVSITWADCNTESYNLSNPQSGAQEMASLTDQSISGITIFVPAGNGSKGFVIKGELAEKTITSFDTPNPEEPHAEISLLEVSTSADRKTMRISVSILNTGDSTFSFSANDIALTDENGATLSLLTSEPALPQRIQPGDTKTILFTFSRPVSPMATLKIFGAEFTIEGY